MNCFHRQQLTDVWEKEKKLENSFPLAKIKDFVEIDVSSGPEKLPTEKNYYLKLLNWKTTIWKSVR